MAAKKKNKKPAKSKHATENKAKSAKRLSKKQPSRKRIAKKKRSRTSLKKLAGTARRRRPSAKRIYTHKEGTTFEPETAGSRTGGQSGDLQGLDDRPGADSESVDELLEEGNAFEADVVAGVERAEDDGEREVHTHEVPEDDVPDEYQDKDS